MQNAPKQLAIFDLDGTLIYTLEDLASSVNASLSSFGFPEHNTDAIKSFVGNGVAKLLERALPEEHRNKVMVQKALERFKAHYDIHCTDLSRPYPGILDLLQKIQKKGITLAVASNKYQSATDKVVSTLLPGIDFAAVLGTGPNTPRKPDPSIVYKILDICGITDKSKVLYTGDSGTDMQTALNAGLVTCAVSWGFRPLSELLPYNPLYTAQTASDIAKILGV